MPAALASCEMDLSVDGVAGGDSGHVEVCTVADLVKGEWHGGEVSMHDCCICGGSSHCAG